MKYLYYNLTEKSISLNNNIFELKNNKNNFHNDFENMKNEYIEHTNEGIYLCNILCTMSNRQLLENVNKDYLEEMIRLSYSNYYEEKPIFILDNQKYNNNNYEEIEISDTEDINDYLHKSRDFDSLVEYYYISFNNKLIMKSIKFKKRYKIVKSLKEDFNNYLEGSYLEENTLCYILDSKIPKLSEKYIIIKVKDENEIKNDILYRNKMYINDKYIVIKNNEKLIKNFRFSYKINKKFSDSENTIPLFVYNNQRLKNLFDDDVKNEIKYIDVNSEEEIKEYLFNRNNNGKIEDYYILNKKCICKNIYLSYKNHAYINNARIDMQISGSYMQTQDTWSLISQHMQLHRKLKNCQL